MDTFNINNKSIQNCTSPPFIEYDDDLELLKAKEYEDKVIGCLLGGAIGDALGRPFEFINYNNIAEIENGRTRTRTDKKYIINKKYNQDLINNNRTVAYIENGKIIPYTGKYEEGGNFHLMVGKGKWTDDTSMTLCLAASLIVKEKFDPYDQLVRFKKWRYNAYMSSSDKGTFGIGASTNKALKNFVEKQKEYAHNYKLNIKNMDNLDYSEINDFNTDCDKNFMSSMGNGCLMKLSPIPLFFARSIKDAIYYAGESAKPIHNHHVSIDGCRYFSALICFALYNYNKNYLLDNNFYENNKTLFINLPLCEEIINIIKGSYDNVPEKIVKRGGVEGNVISTLEAVLYAFKNDNNKFENGIDILINFGYDTDTSSAIYGNLAGAYYGYNKIDNYYKDNLYQENFLKCVAQWLNFKGFLYYQNNLIKQIF